MGSVLVHVQAHLFDLEQQLAVHLELRLVDRLDRHPVALRT